MDVTYRPATEADSYAVFTILDESISDLGRRMGMNWERNSDPRHVWERRRPLYDHIARTADEWWLAEAGGKPVGYARSILRGDMRELTEFFVRPGHQSAGVGRELLARAFPKRDGERRAIIATGDARALTRYMKAGTLAQFPLFNFRRAPESVSVETDLIFEPMAAGPALDETLCRIDREVLGHCRPVDHAWLLTQRAGYVLRREGQAVPTGCSAMGYTYEGDDYGPIALLDPADFPAVLAHAEAAGHARGQADMGFEVPSVNRAAINALLSRGYRLDSFYAYLMADAPFGDFARYVFFSPPFFM